MIINVNDVIKWQRI